jgi:hypothetical protein
MYQGKHMSKLPPNEEVEDVAEDELNETLESFETRWRYAVFPAMIAFVILAGFGFYLIYGMLQRMEDLSKDIHDMTGVITESMPVMQVGIVTMSSRMQLIGEDLHGMRSDMNRLSVVISNTMPAMEGQVGAMSNNISDMRYATSSMAQTTHNMGQNIWNMNRNFSKPLSMMRKIMPWGGDNTPPPSMLKLPNYPNNLPIPNGQAAPVIIPAPATTIPSAPNTPSINQPTTNVIAPVPAPIVPAPIQIIPTPIAPQY